MTFLSALTGAGINHNFGPEAAGRIFTVTGVDAVTIGDFIGHYCRMLGIDRPPLLIDKMIVPPVRGRLKLISIGNFLDDNAPVMWRGPMLHRALEQFLSDVHWGELDTLLVDMPPGTGDVAISLGQLLPRAEVIVVMVQTDAQVEDVVSGSGLLDVVPPGSDVGGHRVRFSSRRRLEVTCFRRPA